MNAEYVWWLVLLVAVGIGVVTYLALGPVPEIPEPTAHDAAGAADAADGGPVRAAGATADRHAPGETAPDGEIAAGPGPPGDGQSSPVSTTEPGPAAPSSTSDTP